MYVANRETGTIIEEVKSVKEGEKLIEKYENKDKKENIYEENFYDIVNENLESLIY